jgi:RDD family
VTSNAGYTLAPLGRRSAAWLLDTAIGTLLAACFVKAAGGQHDLTTMWHLLAFKSVGGQTGRQLSTAMSPASASLAALRPLLGLLAIVSVIFGCTVAYRVGTTAKWGAGLGKTLFGLQVVVDVPGGGGVQTPGWARSWKRWAVPQVPALIPLPATGLLAFAPAWRDSRRRGLHDRAAGTVVIDVWARVRQNGAPVAAVSTAPALAAVAVGESARDAQT